MKFILILTLITGSAFARVDEQRLSESRHIVKAFAAELKGALKPALKHRGSVGAVNLCGELAPIIAKKYSEQTGWFVARTSLKPRNARNSPDGWELKVLQKFERQKSAGVAVSQLEYSEVVTTEQGALFRYMKAIPTQEKPCLACHGENIAPEVLEIINKHYPDDLATGFKAGDIRGAFTLSQPL